MRATGFRRSAAITACAALIGCGDDPGGIVDDALVVSVVWGDEQQGLVGEPLLWPVVLNVTTTSGRPVAGVTPELAVSSGSVVAEPSSGTGRSAVQWTLGAGAGEQVLTVRVSPDAAVSVRAEALTPEMSDVVVLPPGLPDGGGAILVAYGRTLSALWSGPVHAGRVVLPPQKASSREVVVFPSGAAPFVWSGEWTPGADTIHVPARDPVALDISIVLQEPPLNELRAIAERHVSMLDAILRPIGIAVGDVTYRESPVAGVNFMPETFCAGEPSDRIVIHYGATVQGSPGAGYACANRIAMGARTGSYAALLAHEIGHLLGLGHVADAGNFMYPLAPGTKVRVGQSFIAHFATYSALNTVLNATPPELRRDCRSAATAGAVCFDERFDRAF